MVSAIDSLLNLGLLRKQNRDPPRMGLKIFIVCSRCLERKNRSIANGFERE